MTKSTTDNKIDGNSMKFTKLVGSVCLLAVLTFPSVAMAVSVSGTNFIISRRSSASAVIPQFGAMRTHCRDGRVCSVCRVGHSARVRNTHASNIIEGRVGGNRGVVAHPDRQRVRVNPGREANTPVLLGCKLNWGSLRAKNAGNPHRWFVEIDNTALGRAASGSATLVRRQ